MRPSQRKVLVSVTVDTECDKGPDWRIQHPLKFRGVYEGVAERLQPVFEEFGVRPTYLLSPEVIRDMESTQVFKSFGESAELGVHLHAEFIEPENERDPKLTLTMQNVLKPEIEREKIKNLTRLFERSFGRPPTSFRAGRFGLSRYTLPILDELGYIVDSSVAPLSRWSDGGGSVSFFSSPLRPYHPSGADFCKEGDLSILEIPITIGMSVYTRIPRWLREPFVRNRIMRSLVCRVFGMEAAKPIWLRPLQSSVRDMIALSQWWIGRSRHEAIVVLAMMFHNVETVHGCSPYAHTEKDVEKLFESLREYFQFALQSGWHFATLTNAAKGYGTTGNHMVLRM